ncbi:ABC transporter ATP-binding protein [Massilia sp. TSP1-1-2]|uniref:ABC transporter ATP-binding protein n=1 Tax=Massilia sp. TSP1-1-2 TaxID=2804649 RepID=UPI003CE84AEA
MTNPVIDASAIVKKFDGRAVIKQLDWQIAPGQVVGLLGRNGAGKSTLIECLLGLRETDAGTVTIFGDDVRNLSEDVRARIGYVPQQSDLFEWLTARQLLAYFKALYPRWNSEKTDALLARWGLNERACNKPISTLSGGEKQRLSIIRALAHEPDLLILDEPVSALDPVGRREFLRELIDGVIERDTTVVFSTHILSDLERVALDVAFLQDGRIVLQGALDDLMENARRVVGPQLLLAGAVLPGELRRSTGRDGRTSIIVRESAPALALAAREPALRVEALNLEELFAEVTQ